METPTAAQILALQMGDRVRVKLRKREFVGQVASVTPGLDPSRRPVVGRIWLDVVDSAAYNKRSNNTPSPGSVFASSFTYTVYGTAILEIL